LTSLSQTENKKPSNGFLVFFIAKQATDSPNLQDQNPPKLSTKAEKDYEID